MRKLAKVLFAAKWFSGVLVVAVWLVAAGTVLADEFAFAVGSSFEMVRLVVNESSRNSHLLHQTRWIHYWNCEVVPSIDSDTVRFTAELKRVAIVNEPGDHGVISDTNVPNRDDLVREERNWIGEKFHCEFDRNGNFAVKKWPEKIRESMNKRVEQELSNSRPGREESGVHQDEGMRTRWAARIEQEFLDQLFPNFFNRNDEGLVSLKAEKRFCDITGYDFILSLKDAEGFVETDDTIERKRFKLTATHQQNQERVRPGLGEGTTEFLGTAKVHTADKNHVQVFGKQIYYFEVSKKIEFIGLETESERIVDSWTITPIQK